MNIPNGWYENNSFPKLIVSNQSEVVNRPAPQETTMNIDHSELRIERDSFVPARLRHLEREARRLRVELAGDRTARLVVGLDLLIRRAAYRFIGAWRALAAHVVAARHGQHGWRGRSTLRRTWAPGPAAHRGSRGAP
jgi:hypothetical protein